MSTEPTERDVEALVDALRAAEKTALGWKDRRHDIAHALLASSWLAERDAQKRREGAMAVRNALRGDTS